MSLGYFLSSLNPTRGSDTVIADLTSALIEVALAACARRQR
jgi:hypothetical protein